MVNIDDAQATALIAQDKIAKKVKELELQKVNLQSGYQIKSEIVDLEREIEEARKSVEIMLRTYDRVKVVSRPPFGSSQIKNALDAT